MSRLFKSNSILFYILLIYCSVLARDVEDARKDEALEENIRSTEHFKINALCEIKGEKVEVCERIASEASNVLRRIIGVNDPVGKLAVIIEFNKTVIGKE